MKVIGKRISILKKEKLLSIVILPTDDNKKLVLMFLWLMAWTFCGLMFFVNYFKVTNYDLKIAIIVFLSFWFYFEFKIIRAFMWKKWGKEKIWVQNSLLHYQREVNGRGKVREYNLDLLNDLKLVGVDEKNFGDFINQSYWIKGGEMLEFIYQGKSIRFAMQVKPEEARTILTELQQAVLAQLQKSTNAE